MDWLFVGVSVSTAGLGALVVYRLLSVRLRRQAHETGLLLDYLTRRLESLIVEEGVDAAPVAWPELFPVGGHDMECGIDVVDSRGQVVGTALVPVPVLN
jgi:hypothetical protein